MRLRGKVDANQPMIVRELRQLGYSVLSLADLGNGCPDIIVGKSRANVLLEIKDPSQPPSKRKLTPDEEQFFATWKGAVGRVETTEEAVGVLRAYGCE